MLSTPVLQVAAMKKDNIHIVMCSDLRGIATGKVLNAEGADFMLFVQARAEGDLSRPSVSMFAGIIRRLPESDGS